MTKLFSILVLTAVLSGCGTIRYRVDMREGGPTKKSVQWDVVEIKFNNLWKKMY
jgi:uncharacterized protein YceK